MELRLEHGKPMLFAKGARGIRLDRQTFRTEVVTLGEGGVGEKDVLVHDERAAASMSFLLSELEPPAFPAAIGVFRAVERATHHELDRAQAAQAMKRGPGDLEALISAGDTRTVG